ncbi:MAG: hypothetical protein EON60_11840 [Alphaproteobacteria bacterium]|nr:MAG: hypothetical protein EON60_11840 [Alphaproteobacteria bacterium]
MRSRTGQTIRYNLSGTRQHILTLVLLAVLGTSLSACVDMPGLNVSKGTDSLPMDETGEWTYRDPSEKELLLARSDFSVEMVRFTDSRRPRSMELQSDDQMIYQYDPDTLMGGVSYNVPAILGKYLSYRPRMPKNYKVEVELKRLTTVIKAGTLWSGSWGRYNVDLEVTMIARRPDSTVVARKSFRYNKDQRREDFNGRGPTKERDRTRMYDLTETLLRKAAEDIGWEIRQRDARRWHVAEPQSIPTRLNLPPIDAASGTPNADDMPRLSPTLPGAEPVIVPSTPVDTWVDGPQPEDSGTPAPDVMPEVIMDNGLVI